MFYQGYLTISGRTNCYRQDHRLNEALSTLDDNHLGRFIAKVDSDMNLFNQESMIIDHKLEVDNCSRIANSAFEQIPEKMSFEVCVIVNPAPQFADISHISAFNHYMFSSLNTLFN